MCVALMGTVRRVNPEARTAEVEFSGSRIEARTGLVPVSPGDQVLIHAGCILQTLSQSEAEEMDELMKEMREMVGADGGSRS